MSSASCLVICWSPRLLRRRAATRLTLPLCLIWAWLLHGKNILPLVERSLVIWSPPPGQGTLKIRLLLLGSDDGYNWLLRQPGCFGSSIEKNHRFQHWNASMSQCCLAHVSSSSSSFHKLKSKSGNAVLILQQVQNSKNMIKLSSWHATG